MKAFIATSKELQVEDGKKSHLTPLSLTLAFCPPTNCNLSLSLSRHFICNLQRKWVRMDEAVLFHVSEAADY
ncbi:hypothetical protein F0562_007998 [Nyssa sinensis]|uniref:Uncharacterized protein n=1 Tax=Nyssa sinensis TaxID=561372 RepID=A0A5J5A7Q5_9ASTE|nr:hypothetical protein F0562_007998 [Nyssa sinensis]